MKKVNSVIGSIETKNLEQTNYLFCAGAKTVCELLNISAANGRNQAKRTPAWRWRLESKIRVKRKDLSILVECQRQHVVPRFSLRQKYKLYAKRMDIVIEELKQDVKALAAQIKRYADTNTQYMQNKLFLNNQKAFYRSIERQSSHTVVQPNPVETEAFWRSIGGYLKHTTDRLSG